MDLSKPVRLKLPEEETDHILEKVGADTFCSMRPIVLNSITNEASIGDSLFDCLSIIKVVSVEANEDVDISISGLLVEFLMFLFLVLPYTFVNRVSQNPTDKWFGTS